MIVDFRPHARLRGKKPLDIGKSVTPVLEALRDGDADLANVRVVYDWVQYRNNFRDVVDVRRILHVPPNPEVPVPVGVRDEDLEIAVDARRSGDNPLQELTVARLRENGDHNLYLEDWGPGRKSCIWDFNALYWSALGTWEKATGREYEQALPGGESDARNRDGARDLIRDLFSVWDRLSETGALPEQLYIVEFGVGNGNQARVFLDEFRKMDGAHGKEYYRRLHYLMCDYSPHVLELARENVAEHAERVSSFALDATRPCTALGFLRYKVFLIYISNVYDNLPTDEVAHLGGRTYLVETRAYLPAEAAKELADSVSVKPEELPGLVHRLLRLGPSLLADADPARFADDNGAVEFWQKAWELVRLKERYVPLGGLDLYELCPAVGGETLRPLLESGADIRMHVNNGALASFTDSISLLHPYGKLVCHDLFVTDVQGYRTNFRGPGKYDGSVVNWVNGPLLAHVGRRKGFDVRYAPFRHRGGGNIVTMTAQVRD